MILTLKENEINIQGNKLFIDNLAVEAFQENIDRIIGMANLLSYKIVVQFFNKDSFNDSMIFNIEFQKNSEYLNLDFYLKGETLEIDKVKTWVNDTRVSNTNSNDMDSLLNALHEFYFML